MSCLKPFPILNCLDDDVLGVICDHLQQAGTDNELTSGAYGAPIPKSPLQSLSQTCKRLRTHCLPYIFQSFTLVCFGNDSGGFWVRAMTKLKDWNPEYSRYVREVSIHLRRITMTLPVPNDFDEELPDTLASLLDQISSSSTRLTQMTIHIDEEVQAQVLAFKQAFARGHHGSSILFPTVKRLAVGPFNHFIIKHCSNVEFVSESVQHISQRAWHREIGDVSEDVLCLIKKVGAAENLKCFAVREKISGDLMNALYTAIPRIETLVLNSFLWNLTFEQFVAHLSRFRDLQTLSIPEVNNLGLEYRPAPRWVIEQYASGRNVPDQIWEKMANEGRQFRTNVAKAIFAACPWLKELWFLDSIRMTVKEGLDDTSRKAFATRRELDFVEVECDRPMWMWL